MNETQTEARDIQTPDGKIFVRKWIPEKPSSEIPVVLLHDSLGSVDLWREFPEVLAAGLGRGVIAYDRLGFGRSDARTGLPSLGFIEEEATRFFPAVKEKLALGRYILFGHSVGGAMSINIAARDSDCAAVITVASQAFVEDRTVAGIKEAMQGFRRPEQTRRLERWHGSKARWVLRAWADVWLSAEFSGWSLAESIGKVVCPVLAIHGDRDEYGSKAFPEFIAGRAGGVSEMVMLRNCGHLPHREKTREVIEAVQTFLERHIKMRAASGLPA